MVRAFYMRLCVWRIARLDLGESSGLNWWVCQIARKSCHINVVSAILNTLRLRLEETWLAFCQLQRSVESETIPAISTAPCSPAPGRILKITRANFQPASSGIFQSSEDGFSADG